MDSEEQDHIEHLMATGRSANDSGPFYHHTFWESYKGSVKGKLGGILIGGGIGLLVGGVAALFALPVVSGATALAIFGGISAGGMMYGAHEFSEVGRVSGAVSAGLDDAEKRNHEFELSKFSVLNKRLDKIEEMVAGRGALNDPNYQPLTSKPAANEENYTYNEDTENLEKTREKLADYRTTHRKEDKLKERGYFYGNVALVGALVGIGVGLLLATGVGGPAAMAILEHVGLAKMTVVAGAAIPELATVINGAPLFAASAAIFGVIGASFGISRDLFRMVFDKTDTIFKGIVDADKGKKQKEKVQEVAQEVAQPLNLERPKIRTIVYPETYPDMGIKYPQSETHWQSKNPQSEREFALRAQKALEAMDHTQMTGH